MEIQCISEDGATVLWSRDVSKLSRETAVFLVGCYNELHGQAIKSMYDIAGEDGRVIGGYMLVED